MGNDSSKKEKKQPKYNEDIISQLQTFGYPRQQIMVAMSAVSNPNNINAVVDWLEKRRKNGPYANNDSNFNSMSHKITTIQNRYPMFNNSEIKELLYLHNGSVERTLKFLEEKENEVKEQEKKEQKEKEEKERRLKLKENQNENEQITEDELLNVLGGLLSLAIVKECGFILASEENRIALIKRLVEVQCMGQTALRDAVIGGIVLLLKLKSVLLKVGAIKHKFIHIVLTDGCDTSSKSSLKDLQSIFSILGSELGDMCKTFFVGIGLGYKEQNELKRIAELGNDSCEVFNCNDVELDKVFDRIQVDVGLRDEIIAFGNENQMLIAKRQRLQLSLSEAKFLVLFTLDKSGSMAGQRWTRVVTAVAGFCVGMKDTDILGCITFNQEFKLITE